MIFRFNLSLAIFLALSLGASGCAPKSSGLPLDVPAIAQLAADNTAQISYVESGDEILVTIIDTFGDSHVHRMNFEGMSRQRALEILRGKQEELRRAHRSPADMSFPFETVVLSNGQILATLSSQSRLFIQKGTEKPRLLESAESLKLEAGVPVRLFERHISFLVTAQTEAPADIQIQQTDNGYGERVTNNYFVPAR